MQQLELLNQPDPDPSFSRHRGNAESRDAFEAIKGKLPAARARVLEFVRSRGEQGATTDEVAAAFGVGANVVSGRLSELKRDGLLVPTANKRVTRNGQNARVFVAK